MRRRIAARLADAGVGVLKIFAHAVIGVALVLPPELKADDGPATAPEPGSMTAATQAQTLARKPPPPLYFKTSRLYVERQAAFISDPTAPAAPALDLELRPSDIQWMMSQLQLRPEDEDGTIEVRGELDTSGPHIPGGIGSLFWSIKNPKQAWRIFAPVQ